MVSGLVQTERAKPIRNEVVVVGHAVILLKRKLETISGVSTKSIQDRKSVV